MGKGEKPNEKTTTTSGKAWWICRVVILLFGLLVYREAFLPGNVLFTTDDNIGAMASREKILPQAFLGGWADEPAAGQPLLVPISWTNLMLWILPLKLFVNSIHALDLILASLCLLGFFRLRGMHPASALMAVLAAFWVGSNFFLTYAGHIGKFGVLLMAALYLYLLEVSLQKRSWAWAALAGGALGGMFLEQADSALFFALFLGPYAVIRAGEVFAWRWAGWKTIVLPVASLSLLIGVHAIMTGYMLYKMDMPDAEQAVSEEAANQELWEYCTQWSLPPLEVIEWVAPGYLGWRSGEPTGPYWGKLGQSAGFQQSGQGFRNFKLETFYKGAIPVLLFLFGAGLFFVRGLTLPMSRLEGRFWVAAVVLSFLLGLGKFFPLYSLFFHLPGMSSIRNPVKFLQFTQMGMAVLAGVGLEGLIRQARSPATVPGIKTWLTWAFRISAGLGGLFVLMGLLFVLTQTATAERFAADGYGQLASVMTANRIRAIFWAAGMTGLTLGAGWWMLKGGRSAPVYTVAFGLTALVAADQLIQSRHYVSAVPARSLVGEQAPVSFIKQNLGYERLLLLSQQGVYNNWLTILLPYNGITTFNIAQMRMPEDYKAFFAAVGQSPLLMWAHFGVGLMMGPGQFWNQIQNDPGMKDRFELVYAFNILPYGDGVMTEPASRERPGREVILKPRSTWHRYRLYNQWVTVPETRVLPTIQQTNPMRSVVLSDQVQGLPAVSAEDREAGDVGVVSYRPGRAHLKVNAETDAVLRLADKYTLHWRATIDGKPADVFRCDYLFQGVVVPAGIRDVVVEYQPPLGGLWIQLAGFAGLTAALASLVISRRRQVPETAQ
ncbi:MAG: hypothetical protein KDL31_00600 [Kiritimatiellae bacterium]|nr:hypothetical protein [Kiritimatiellia bacterium]